MLIVRSNCKRGKIIPLWGTELLLQAKEKRNSKPKSKEEIQEKAEFYPDKSTNESYSWMFVIEGSIIIYTYFHETEEVKKGFA